MQIRLKQQSLETVHTHTHTESFNNQKGITLIALVITIIILLILAGITIGTLMGENGILTKATQAEEETKKAQYKELVDMIIMEKQLERMQNPTATDPFIKVVAKAIEEKEWSKEVTICDENENDGIDFKKATQIIVETKDGYEIIVKIDNEGIAGEVVSVTKGIGKKYKITFDANFDGNEGTGEVPKEIERRQGFYAILPNGESLNQSGKKLVGWSEDPKAKDTDTSVYACGSSYLPSKEKTTLYAVWAEDTIKITFNANGGYGEMDNIDLLAGKDTKLPKNLFERDGWKFKEWNTEPDGNGTSYAEEDSVTFSTDTPLYAIWNENITATLNVTNNKFTEETIITLGGTAIANGIQKISLIVGNTTIYSENGNGNTNYSKTLRLQDLNQIALASLDFYDITVKLSITTTINTTTDASVDIKNYTIGNGNALRKLARMIHDGNSFAGEKIKIISDIELDGWFDRDFVRQSNPGSTFAGSLDGDFHTIKNFSSNYRLFDVLDKSAEVRSLLFDSVWIGLDGENSNGIITSSDIANRCSCWKKLWYY